MTITYWDIESLDDWSILVEGSTHDFTATAADNGRSVYMTLRDKRPDGIKQAYLVTPGHSNAHIIKDTVLATINAPPELQMSHLITIWPSKHY